MPPSIPDLPPPTTTAITHSQPALIPVNRLIDNPPTPPPNAPRVAIIGAGSRGNAYAAALYNAGAAHIVAVAEPRTAVRETFGRTFIWRDSPSSSDGQSFESWQDLIDWARNTNATTANKPPGTGIDLVFVCVQDAMHLAVVRALAELGGLHILCEKPLATRLNEVLEMSAALKAGWARTGRKTVFGVGHVLRYAPHNVLLRELVRERGVVGDVLSVEHTEPVGWWHFSHSYVRGNWRKEKTSAGSLLTKSCHDMDFLMWLLCSPPPGSSEEPHLPSQIASTGSLRYFRKARKPAAAGDATNCLSCPIEESCEFSANNIYVKKHLDVNNTKWPVKIVLPDVEDLLRAQGAAKTRNQLLDILREDYSPTTSPDEIEARQWYGRCVYESDNDVCDDQTVTIEWADDPLPTTNTNNTNTELGHRGAKTALFHMVALTEAICARRGRIYGTKGELSYDSQDISVYSFATGQTTVHHVPAPQDSGHGGGDDALALNMVKAVSAVQAGEMDVDAAQWAFLGVDLDEIVRSHAAVFAAEDARTKGVVVQWDEWWAREVEKKTAI
ncbi:streptomycin biosynthesis protein StrI [Microthyrium microscopicum]|uniref:Streptomycin biosynthesis protein StrI n=1 Tax=Microthyrium microscopicum TaxID=703497 RepID=A0A6A6U1V0_9PEZI|nr:streptomycin biosynthesis protein StrI [Microthyrium microscopicum]